jgi:hypothetical protein
LLCQHTSAYVSMRQQLSAYVSTPVVPAHLLLELHYFMHTSDIRQHTSAYVSIRQHTSACLPFPLHLLFELNYFMRTLAIRQHTSAFLFHDLVLDYWSWIPMLQARAEFLERHASSTTPLVSAYFCRHKSCGRLVGGCNMHE